MLFLFAMLVLPPVGQSTDHVCLQGDWEYVSAFRNGTKCEVPNTKLGVGGDFMYFVGKVDPSSRYAKFYLSHDTSPKQIDVWVYDDDNEEDCLFVLSGIYELSEDKLRLCFSKVCDLRPSEFSKDGQLYELRRK